MRMFPRYAASLRRLTSQYFQQYQKGFHSFGTGKQQFALGKTPLKLGRLSASLPTSRSLFMPLSFSFATFSLPFDINFSSMGLLGWFAVDLGINWAGWVVASALKTEVFYDAVGSLSFATLTLGSFLFGGGTFPRKILVSAMVGGWTLRLGAYLISRIRRDGHDSRFEKAKNEPGTFFVYWTMQAVWVFTTLLPVLLVNLSPATAPLRAVDAVGIAVYGTGLMFETVADWQKWEFKNDSANKGKFISSGLWSISRHPNYFGEILVWTGVFLSCCPALQGWQWVSVVSPLFVTLLLTQVSGIPILERQADKRWGQLEEYKQYKSRTPVLIPWPAAHATRHDA